MGGPILNLVASNIVRALQTVLSASAILDEPADVQSYLPEHRKASGGAICVVRPRSTEQISAALCECHKLGVPVVARGGGTGLVGGAQPMPEENAVILSLDRMRMVRSIDTTGNAMVVEAGCTLASAQEAARSAGRVLGIDHGGAGSSQIGGNLATNAGGNNVIRYGMARDQVLSVEAVLADGTIIGDLRGLRKNNAGYDLKSLLIGSEGTLAIIAAAALKLRPAPVGVATALLGIETAEHALDLLRYSTEIFGESLVAFELMSRSAMAFSQRGAKMELAHLPATDAPFALLVECESVSSFFDLDGAMGAFLSGALDLGLVASGALAASGAHRQAMWRLREGIAVAMDEAHFPVVKTDTAVPVGAIADFIALIEEQAPRIPDARIPIFFGHVGDGNIHVNILPADPSLTERFRAAMPEAYRLIEDAALAFGSTVSAEHGIGQTKRDALERMLQPAEIALMRRIRSAYDPSGLLNPGKVLFSRRPSN